MATTINGASSSSGSRPGAGDTGHTRPNDRSGPGEVNYLRTGYVNRELLDVHIITDDDITRQTSYASKIGAVTDPALELPLGAADNSTHGE